MKLVGRMRNVHSTQHIRRMPALLLIALAATLIVAMTVSSASASRDATATTLNVSIAGPPDTLNPFTTFGTAGHILSVMFEPLVTVDSNSRVAPGVASGWTVSKDARRFTFRLRTNIRWTDGKRMTAKDVLWTFTTYLDSRVNSQASRFGGVVGQKQYAAGKASRIRGLSTPNANTFVVTLEKPNVAWLANLAGGSLSLPILPSHVLGKVPRAKLKTSSFFTNPNVSFGPYKFVRWARDQFIEFRRNDNWYRGRAGFPRLVMKVLTADVAAVQLRTRELQFSPSVSPDVAESLKEDSGLRVRVRGGTWPYALHLNNGHPLLKDRRVRQALIHAIDRKKLCDELARGYCVPPRFNVRQITPAWALPKAKDINPLAYNPAKARELLAQAGWDTDTEITGLQFSGEDATSRNVFTVIQAQLAAAGIKMKIRTVTIDQLLEAFEGSGRNGWQLSYSGGGTFAIDPDAGSPWATCSTFYPNGANTSHFCNPELDKLWAAGRRISDPKKRAPIYQRAFALMNDDPSAVVLYWPTVNVAHDKRLRGVIPMADSGMAFSSIGKWTWEG